MLTDVTAFAPATVANVGIGFDILGHTVEALGDRVRLRRIEEPVVRIRSISGIAGDLPVEPANNTAGRAVQAMHASLALNFGFEMDIEKGIPLGSGLGGSAASAVAAVVAANALLEAPLPRLQLLKFAMEGEIVASGAAHIDNIAPCLFGGLTLTVGIDHPRVKQIPVPPSLRCVLAHPHMYLGTREARAILKADITRSDFVWASANLAGFISGCYSNDLDMMRDSFNDVIIEPQRQSLIPGFKDVQRGAMSAGALGCSISGAGPTVFAWAEIQYAEAVRGAMVAAFAAHGLKSDYWISGHGELRRQSGEGLMVPLKFASSRGGAPAVSLSEAIARGLAPDGGLYIPTRLPAAAAAGLTGSAALPRIARGRRWPDSSRATACNPCSARLPTQRSICPPRPPSSKAAPTRCLRSSSITGRPRPSRISARASWPRVCSACRIRQRRP